MFHLDQLTAKAVTWFNVVQVSQVVLYLRRPETHVIPHESSS